MRPRSCFTNNKLRAASSRLGAQTMASSDGGGGSPLARGVARHAKIASPRPRAERANAWLDGDGGRRDLRTRSFVKRSASNDRLPSAVDENGASFSELAADAMTEEVSNTASSSSSSSSSPSASSLPTPTASSFSPAPPPPPPHRSMLSRPTLADVELCALPWSRSAGVGASDAAAPMQRTPPCHPRRVDGVDGCNVREIMRIDPLHLFFTGLQASQSARATAQTSHFSGFLPPFFGAISSIIVALILHNDEISNYNWQCGVSRTFAAATYNAKHTAAHDPF